jgi:broad specificity phosphatase PhoE
MLRHNRSHRRQSKWRDDFRCRVAHVGVTNHSTRDDSMLAPWRFAGARVLLIRHAHAKEGAKDPDRGHHLSDVGRRQAEALAHRAAKWQLDAIICSDMYRAYETAAAIHAFHPNVSLVADATFRELSAGTLAAFERGDPAQIDLGARLQTAWGKILAMPYRMAAVITHNGLLKYLLGRAIEHERYPKPPFHSALTGISGLQVKPNGRAHLRFFNDTHHLSPELVVDAKTWIENDTGTWSFGVDDEHHV